MCCTFIFVMTSAVKMCYIGQKTVQNFSWVKKDVMTFFRAALHSPPTKSFDRLFLSHSLTLLDCWCYYRLLLLKGTGEPKLNERPIDMTFCKLKESYDKDPFTPSYKFDDLDKLIKLLSCWKFPTHRTLFAS